MPFIQNKHDIGWLFRPVKFLVQHSKGCYVVTLRLLSE